MIAKAGQPTLDLPPGVAFLAIVLSPAGTIRCYSAMARIPREDFESIIKGREKLCGSPIYWTPWETGAAIWPRPDRDYEITARNSAGAVVGSGGKPMPMAPVEAYTAAFAKAQAEADRVTKLTPGRVERFDRHGGDPEE